MNTASPETLSITDAYAKKSAPGVALVTVA
jgi:hypothetical protein